MTLLRTLVHTVGSLALAALVSSQMVGCADMQRQSGGTANADNDIITASDEGDVRRRGRIRLELATTYYAQGQYTTALDELKKAEAADASLTGTGELRALIYDAMGDTARAEASYKDALAKEPGNGSVMHNYAWFLCRARQFAAADAMFERAVAQPQTIDPSKTLLARGVCQISAGLYPEAEKTLGRSYEIDPSNPATAFNLASLLYRRGELERARFYIRRVNNVQTQVTAESLWLALRIEHRLENMAGRDELATQLRSRFPAARETNALELGRFDE